MKEKILKKIDKKKLVIGVIGLGYVGLPIVIKFSKVNNMKAVMEEAMKKDVLELKYNKFNPRKVFEYDDDKEFKDYPKKFKKLQS